MCSVTLSRTDEEVVFGFVGPSLWSLLYPQRADGSIRQKAQEIPKPSQKQIFLGIPTNVIVGPLGFQTDLDISPKGEKIVLIAMWEQTGPIDWC